jgi:hypothetical protein
MFTNHPAHFLAPQRPRMPHPPGHWAALVMLIAISAVGVARAGDAEAIATSEKRLADATRYLAADELEGRGVGTPGIDKAADYVAEQFAALGLNTKLYEGTPFQKFSMTIGVKLGDKNELSLVRPAGESGGPIELRLEQNFTPLSLGGSGKLDVPLVFAGYGITGKDEGYDDYAGINVEGKAVIVLRHEPQQDNPHSAFAGTQDSSHGPVWRKISNAYEHGAAAVVLCTDEVEIRKQVEARRKQLAEAVDELAKAEGEFQKIEQPTTAEINDFRAKIDELAGKVTSQSKNLGDVLDPLKKFRDFDADGQGSTIPVIHCRRADVDAMLKAALGADLSTLERDIDHGPTPQSRDIPGWRLAGEVSVVRRQAEVKNVVAVLDGEGPLADETIVIGAHYDHLGLGGSGSRAIGEKQIHNGADDNGSGTAALIEVARILATRGKKLPRRVVFIAFTGEERGLIGSARYCREPLFP